MSTFEYVFIGAGLANLAAARNLVGRGVNNLAILDSGRKLDRRVCPGVKPQKCVFCAQGCSILSGIGGTNAMYGNKMCYFPASSRILDYFPNETITEAWHWLDSVLFPWFKSRNNRHDTESNDLGIKHYESEVFSPSQFGTMISSLARPLMENGLIREGSEVLNVGRDAGEFVISLKSGVNLRSKNVVLGAGRSGGDLTRLVCESLGVALQDNFPDVGFRIEAPKELFSDFYRYQEDPKLKKTYPEGTVRTFCAENGGIIVPVPFREGFFAEGAYPQVLTGENNVALMVRSDIPLSSDALRDWCVGVNRRYKNLKIGEFEVSSLSPAETMSGAMRCVPPLPTTAHDSLMANLVAQLSSLKTPLFRASYKRTTVKVYGPAIDNYWPIPNVGFELRTPVPGFFLVGDSLGVSRGYVQALTSGAAWALTQSNPLTTQTSKPQSKCLVLA